jgi:hypothetical protein
MVKPPAIDEREFLKLTRNHGEFCDKLRTLGYTAASADLIEIAQHIGLSWPRLAHEHLNDGRAAEKATSSRASCSRSYYAVYNASKAVRYIVSGMVSLKSDDHKDASELPDDFPDVEKWTDAIIKFKEHRLRADYDNWIATQSEHSRTSAETIALAEGFLWETSTYLEAKFGIRL